MDELKGKVAIVTGGGQGIGRSESLFLAAHGAAVVVNDRGGLIDGMPHADSFANCVVAEIQAAGGRAVANFGDVADWASAQAMVEQAIESFGRLDILVCNAGIVRDRMTHNLTEAEWDAVISVHLKGHFAPTHFAAVHWRKVSKETGAPVNGRIVYTSSEAGLYGNLGQPNYSAAKAGIVGLCLEVSKELQRIGCTVNTISPRGRTPMTEGTFGDFKLPEGAFDAWDPDNVAPWVGFLACDAAAKITGQIFVVFGGTVRRMEPWSVSTDLSKNGRWTLQELTSRAHELIPGLEASAPPFPDVGMPVQ